MPQPLFGVIPPIATPFDADGNVLHPALREVVEFQINAGVHGLVAGGSTGEGHTFERDDFVAMMETVAAAARGRVPVLAGIIVNSTNEAIARANRLRHLDIAALQVTPVHYLFKPDDDATVAHFRAVAEGTGKPVIIYNVIPWNYLSPALLLRVMREVPGVVGVKQSSGDLKLLADLLLAAPADKLIFTAIDALLYPSYALGACGAIAAMPAAAPHANVALWNAMKAGDHAAAKALHERLLVLWNALSAENLPANVKYALAVQGVPAGLSRRPMPMPDEARRAAIRAALAGLGATIRAAA
ncbi:MAG: dihydrodipicolinate synthase family protein [Rhodospirillales bacterium 70-18]|nr:dihydrodipicolinate synthase family protein [Rhodospirillales bacterium]OJY63466.1 MAG: dihydrodipicolinate synthase family protein [Rhodospirillales bacterium 70-18]